MTVRHPGGRGSEIILLRPLEWIEATGATEGRPIELNLEEQGLSGPALVLSVAPCPRIEAGPGDVVTGTFKHFTDSVLWLRVEGVQDPIGITSNHPVYSVDRTQFVPAESLQRGDLLQLLDGTGRLQDVQVGSSTQAVFNLEVNSSHVFRVSAAGVLVHNTSPPPRRKQGGKYTEPELPPKTIVDEGGVSVEHYTRSGDHGPPHAHVKGGGPETKIGQNGKAIDGSPDPTPTQRRVIDNNRSVISKAISKIMAWFRFENEY
jgi:hypothetical protein